MSNDENTPKGAYRVVRQGWFDYWVQQWSGTDWVYIWPCICKFTAVWFIVSRKEMIRLEKLREANTTVVWQE